jgi:hypothetical protein
MDRKIVDPLLRLLDQRILEDSPIQLARITIDFLERLIDRNGTDRDGRVADDPASDVMNIATGREVHHRVSAPADRPHKLLNLFRGARCYG